ncbi:hypothetical protein KBD20_03060 [Candidatus Saccharibacteria bacterium]|nr:hypothetical protein [Candidatus Saccharibacteria bacterium]
MEDKRGAISHFSGIIRIVIFAILAILLVVLFTRWAISRRESNKSAQNVTESSQKEDSKTATTENNSSGSESEESKSNTETTTIPSGIAESTAEPEPGTRVPNAGIGTNIAITIAMLTAITYLLIYNRTLSRNLLVTR